MEEIIKDALIIAIPLIVLYFLWRKELRTFCLICKKKYPEIYDKIGDISDYGNRGEILLAYKILFSEIKQRELKKKKIVIWIYTVLFIALFVYVFIGNRGW